MVGASVCSGQAWIDIFEGPEHLGNQYYSQYCEPYEPIGTELDITFTANEISDWAYLYLEAFGVDPDEETFQNEVFLNGELVGSLQGFPIAGDCVFQTVFAAYIGDILQLGDNTLLIVSGYDGGSNWDDYWVRNIRVYPSSIPYQGESWGSLKAFYR